MGDTNLRVEPRCVMSQFEQDPHLLYVSNERFRLKTWLPEHLKDMHHQLPLCGEERTRFVSVVIRVQSFVKVSV